MSRSGALNVAYAIRRNRAGGGRLYRAEGGGAEFPAWMNADALSSVSGPQEEMTRGLTDYESRDPNELAMLRHREMVRPTRGRQDFPMEHLTNMATAGLMLSPLGAGPLGAALAPEAAVGRGLSMAAQYAPRLTTAGLAGVGAMAPSMTEGAENQQAALPVPKDPQAIRELQTQLRAAGFPVDVDGIMRPGGPTERALKQFQEQEAVRRAEDLKRRELDTQQGANAASLETARANQATAAAKLEADRLKAQKDADDLARKQAGDERMREIDKNLPLSSRIMRDYSGPAGMVAGMVGGSLGRWLTQSKADKAIKETANAGNAVMAEDVALGKKGAEAALARATRANAFWRMGGAKEVPFRMEAGKAPGFAVNPEATALNKTYSPQIHPAVEAAAAAPAALEWGVSNHYKNKWEEELHEAQKALSEDQSEANIQRLNKAKDNVGLFTGLERFGQTALGIQAVGGVGSRFMPKGPHMRPNMQPAEQEQGSLQEIIRKAAATAEKKAAKDAVKSTPRKPLPILPSAPALTVDAARARSGSNLPMKSHGGGIRSPMDVAYAVRRANRAEGGSVHAGPILSSVPGRTDHHPMDVEEGAYILPADHVSSLGEGNTMAGMEVVNHMIETLGADPQHRGDGEPVPINAAGGEVAIPPAVVMAIGGGDIKRGHEMLDQWVLMNRRKHISTLRGLPGPAKS